MRQFLISAATAAGLLLAAVGAATAQTPQRPINERVMYGDVEKSAEMKAADKELIETFLAHGESRESGARILAGRGFEALRQGDMSTAIKRFNQSWVLDPDNGGAHWGFAIVLAERDRNVPFAELEFKRALELLPDEAGLMVDVGRFYGKTNRPRQAIPYLQAALGMDPKAPGAHQGLSAAYARLGEFKSALVHARAAVANGNSAMATQVRTLECLVAQLDAGQQLSRELLMECHEG